MRIRSGSAGPAQAGRLTLRLLAEPSVVRCWKEFLVGWCDDSAEAPGDAVCGVAGLRRRCPRHSVDPTRPGTGALGAAHGTRAVDRRVRGCPSGELITVHGWTEGERAADAGRWDSENRGSVRPCHGGSAQQPGRGA